MTNRSVQYEAALEDFLRANGVPCVATNEARRALRDGFSIKSVDFLVSVPDGPKLIVEVKGKRFPYRRRGGRNYWESWVHREDVDALYEWADVLGPEFKPLLVFVYKLENLNDRRMRGPQFATLHYFRGDDYALMGIEVGDFVSASRVRSRSWDALDVPVEEFLKFLRPFEYFLGRTEVLRLFRPEQGKRRCSVRAPT